MPSAALNYLQEDLNLPQNKKEQMRQFDDDRKWAIMQATIKEQVRVRARRSLCLWSVPLTFGTAARVRRGRTSRRRTPSSRTTS